MRGCLRKAENNPTLDIYQWLGLRKLVLKSSFLNALLKIIIYFKFFASVWIKYNYLFLTVAHISKPFFPPQLNISLEKSWNRELDVLNINIAYASVNLENWIDVIDAI